MTNNLRLSSSSQQQHGRKKRAPAWMVLAAAQTGPNPEALISDTDPATPVPPLAPIAPTCSPASAPPIPPTAPTLPLIPPAPPIAPIAPTPPLIPPAPPIPPVAPAPLIPPITPTLNAQLGSTGLDGRMHIGMVRGGLYPSSKIAKIMKECIQLEMEPKGYTFKGVTQQAKDFYWREFQKSCYWDAAIDATVKIAYKGKFSKTYSKYVSKVKAKGIRPICMSEEVWHSWKAYWASPESRQKSKQAKLNKHGGIENGPVNVHTGGPISQTEHYVRLSNELGGDITAYDLFKYTHTHAHDGKSFADDRSRMVHERMESMLQRMEQSANDVVSQTNLFYKATGGFNKSRIYGLGFGAGYYSSIPQSTTSTSSSQSSSSTSGAEQISHIENRLGRLQQNIESVTQLRHEDLEELRHQGHRMERIDKRLEDVVRLVKELSRELDAIHRGSSSSS